MYGAGVETLRFRRIGRKYRSGLKASNPSNKILQATDTILTTGVQEARKTAKAWCQWLLQEFLKVIWRKQTSAGIALFSSIIRTFLTRSARGFGTGHSPYIEPNLMENMLSCPFLLCLLKKLISLTKHSWHGVVRFRPAWVLRGPTADLPSWEGLGCPS